MLQIEKFCLLYNNALLYHMYSQLEEIHQMIYVFYQEILFLLLNYKLQIFDKTKKLN